MRIIFPKNFRKRYEKLQQKEQTSTDEHIRLFYKNTSHPTLHNHALHGIYKGCHSINITDNLRAIYEEVDQHTAYFIVCGTHAELYE